MTLYEIGFKLQHDCPFNDLSRKYPRAVIALWCNNKKDVLEITCDEIDLFQRIQADMDSFEKELGVKVLRKSFSSTNAQLVIQTCSCHLQPTPSICSVIEKHNSMEVQPTIYKEGWEWYRVIAFNQKDIKGMFNALEKFANVEVVSRRIEEEKTVRDSFVISTSNLLGALTEKQTFALLAALDHGYYRVPKQVTTDEIAKSLGVPRTTYEEHLRKAESKVLRSLVPYIQVGIDAHLTAWLRTPAVGR